MTHENGNGARDDQAAPEHWRNVESDMQRVADPVVRGILIEQLERDREQWQQRQRYIKHFADFRKEVGQRDARILGDMMTLMKGIARVETKLDVVIPTMQVHGVKIAGLDRDVDRTSRDVVALRTSDAEIEKRQALAERRLAENTSRYAVERVRLEERIAWGDRRLDKIEGVVAKTGENVAVSLELADRALDSTHEILDERHEGREELREKRKEVREFKWHTWKWALALVSALVLLGAGALINKLTGSQPVPHLSAPAAAH